MGPAVQAADTGAGMLAASRHGVAGRCSAGRTEDPRGPAGCARPDGHGMSIRASAPRAGGATRAVAGPAGTLPLVGVLESLRPGQAERCSRQRSRFLRGARDPDHSHSRVELAVSALALTGCGSSILTLRKSSHSGPAARVRPAARCAASCPRVDRLAGIGHGGTHVRRTPDNAVLGRRTADRRFSPRGAGVHRRAHRARKPLLTPRRWKSDCVFQAMPCAATAAAMDPAARSARIHELGGSCESRQSQDPSPGGSTDGQGFQSASQISQQKC